MIAVNHHYPSFIGRKVRRESLLLVSKLTDTYGKALCNSIELASDKFRIKKKPWIRGSQKSLPDLVILEVPEIYVYDKSIPIMINTLFETHRH